VPHLTSVLNRRAVHARSIRQSDLPGESSSCVIAKFVAHRHKEVQNKAKKVVGIVNLYEVQCADGKAPTVQTWCPRNIQTVEEATAQCPCTFKEGQRLVVGFDSMEPNNFDAKNGVIIRAVSVLPLE
jgi:hypothetical protein